MKVFIFSIAVVLLLIGFASAMDFNFNMRYGATGDPAPPGDCASGHSKLVGSDTNDILDSTGGFICTPD